MKPRAQHAQKRDPEKFAHHVRTPALGDSELSYVATSVGAAPPDVRSQLEVILVDEADKTIVHRGVEQHIRTGLVGIRSPFEVGRLVRRHSPETKVRVLAIGNDGVGPALEAMGVRPRDLPSVLTYIEAPKLHDAACSVFEAVEAGEPAFAVENRLAVCAAQVARTLLGRAYRAPTAVDRTAAERIRVALHDWVTETFTLDDLAREVSLSRAYVVNAFRRAFQISPYKYLMHLRVARARTLLAAGERPTDVAHACGFCDQSHLNRWFRKVVGVTPGEYGRSTT